MKQNLLSYTMIPDPSLCIRSGLAYMIWTGKVFTNGRTVQAMASLSIGEMVNRTTIMVKRTVLPC